MVGVEVGLGWGEVARSWECHGGIMVAGAVDVEAAEVVDRDPRRKLPLPPGMPRNIRCILICV